MAYSRTLTLKGLEKLLDEKQRSLPDGGAALVQEAFKRARGPSWTMALDTIQIRGFKAYQPSDGADGLLLRAADRNLRVLSRVKQSNRNAIVASLASLISEGMPFCVHRMDVKSFYENIPQHVVQQRLETDLGVSTSTKKAIRALFAGADALGLSGLPRGVPVSATLAEDHMRTFDIRASRLPGVFFYARFVDDIIIVSSPHMTTDLRGQIEGLLSDRGGLRLNPRKTLPPIEIPAGLAAPPSTEEFEYLGYKFVITARKNKGCKMVIDVADSKVKKFKTRLSRAAASFATDPKFGLLYDRVRALTGNYLLQRPPPRHPIMAGIYYSYPLVGAYDYYGKERVLSEASQALSELDSFKHSLFFRKATPLSRMVDNQITAAQRRLIQRLSFRVGHRERRIAEFSPTRLGEIKECWRNV